MAFRCLLFLKDANPSPMRAFLRPRYNRAILNPPTPGSKQTRCFVHTTVTVLKEVTDCAIPRAFDSLSGEIDAQNLNEIRNFFQMPQCVPSGLVIAPQEINKEDVLPRAAAHRARFDLAEADV